MLYRRPNISWQGSLKNTLWWWWWWTFNHWQNFTYGCETIKVVWKWLPAFLFCLLNNYSCLKASSPRLLVVFSANAPSKRSHRPASESHSSLALGIPPGCIPMIRWGWVWGIFLCAEARIWFKKLFISGGGDEEIDASMWFWKDVQSALRKFHLGTKLKLACPEGTSSW